VSEILSREDFMAQLHRLWDSWEPAPEEVFDGLVAHDKALRAQVEKLEESLRRIADGDVAGFGQWFVDEALAALEGGES